jgi:hypothetical protein
MKRPSTLLQNSHKMVPPTIDLVTLLGMIFFVPWFGGQLFTPSSVNHFLLIPGFFLIVTGIFAIRSLPRDSHNDADDPSFVAICLVFFLMVTYLLLYVYATNLGGSESDNDGIVVILFFIYLIPVIGSLYWRATASQPGSTRALIAQSVGLISVNYLTLIGESVWYYFSSLPLSGDPVYAKGFSFLVLYTILFLLFLAFFGLPRIYLFKATNDKLGLTLYIGGIAVYLWDKVPPI